MFGPIPGGGGGGGVWREGGGEGGRGGEGEGGGMLDVLSFPAFWADFNSKFQ